MAYGVSNSHVTDDVTWHWKVKLVTPIRKERNISKTAGDRDSVLKNHQQEMAYGVWNVVWGSTVVYPSDSLASCFYFLLFLMCHYAVMLSPRGQSGPKVCPRQRGYFLLVVLWNRASIYVGFWRWALGILQYPSRKRILCFQRGPDLKKWRRSPGGCVTPMNPIRRN